MCVEGMLIDFRQLRGLLDSFGVAWTSRLLVCSLIRERLLFLCCFRLLLLDPIVCNCRFRSRTAFAVALLSRTTN